MTNLWIKRPGYGTYLNNSVNSVTDAASQDASQSCVTQDFVFFSIEWSLADIGLARNIATYSEALHELLAYKVAFFQDSTVAYYVQRVENPFCQRRIRKIAVLYWTIFKRSTAESVSQEV